MTHTLFLKIALPVIAIPALIVLVLPSGVWPTYVDVVEPVSLLFGSVLALYVSFSYRKELKTAFIFLSVFLLIYALAIVLFLAFSPILIPFLQTRLGGDQIFSLVQTIQFINYAMLFFFCINILRVIDIKTIGRNGWIVLGVTIPFCGLLAIFPVVDEVRDIWNQALPVINYFFRQLLDYAAIVVLIPVLWAYVQYLKSRKKQTVSFTVVVFGSALALLILFWILLAIFPVLPSIRELWSRALPQISFLTVRAFDAILIIVLVPVVWLYFQFLKSQQRQSLTFTVIISGIVFFTLFDYLFELIVAIFPNMLADTSSLHGTIPEALFIYGYLAIAVGLYAHRKQDEWGFNAIEKTLSGELELVDID